jgi:hypothetical protein
MSTFLDKREKEMEIGRRVYSEPVKDKGEWG